MIDKFDRIIGIIAFGAVLSVVVLFALSGLVSRELLPVSLFACVFCFVGLVYHSINLYRLCNDLEPIYMELF